MMPRVWFWQSFKQRLNQRFSAWLDRRIPKASQVCLNQRRIFILPSSFGWMFLGLTVLIFLLGVNYRSSLALAVSFLLLSLFLVAILETYRNLAGLSLQACRSGEGLVGEEIGFELQLKGRRHRSLELGWPGGATVLINVSPAQPTRLHLFQLGTHRGRLKPGRFRVASQYPLGLFEAWSWVDLGFSGLVYPKPLETPLPMLGWQGGDGAGQVVSGLDDFVGLKRYQSGDALSQIAWKKQAKGGALLSKHFATQEGSRLKLCWQDTQGDIERRLRQLSFWVLEAERLQLAYGLSLPGNEVELGLGAEQRKRCLRALALFSVPGSSA